MAVTWILAANGSRARILETRALAKAPDEIADFVNPAARAAGRELHSDAEGRFHDKRGQGHVAVTGEDPTDHEMERFVIDVRNYLEHARHEHRFDDLWVIAAPALLGFMRKMFAKPLRQTIKLELSKDLTMATPADIVRHGAEALEARAGS